MKKLKSILLLVMVALLPVQLYAEEAGGKGEELDIPEIVLEHLADAYEWHIASYKGKHLSIPLPSAFSWLATFRRRPTASGISAG